LIKDYTEYVGIVAGVFTAMSLLPQLIKLVREKKAGDLSLFFLIVLFIGLGFWIWYGILRNDLPIIITNAFSIVVNFVIIVLGIKYKKENHR
jgi:MtN3 and saliva related transmembrane protein